eukprot:scaffold1850_cov50-Cyclotella_meneghiniana.AAC.3
MLAVQRLLSMWVLVEMAAFDLQEALHRLIDESQEIDAAVEERSIEVVGERKNDSNANISSDVECGECSNRNTNQHFIASRRRLSQITNKLTNSIPA